MANATSAIPESLRLSLIVHGVAATLLFALLSMANLAMIRAIGYSRKMMANATLYLVRMHGILAFFATAFTYGTMLGAQMLVRVALGRVLPSWSAVPLCAVSWHIACCAPLGQALIAANRFAAVFFPLQYEDWFTIGRSKIAFFVPTLAIGYCVYLGGSWRFDEYGICLAEPDHPLWVFVYLNLTVSTLVSLGIYAAIYVRIARTPSLVDREEVRKRARGSLMMFAASLAYCLGTIPAAFLSTMVNEQTGASDLVRFGLVPLLIMDLYGSTYGLNLATKSSRKATPSVTKSSAHSASVTVVKKPKPIPTLLHSCPTDSRDKRDLNEKFISPINWRMDSGALGVRNDYLSLKLKQYCSDELHAKLFSNDFKEHAAACQLLSNALDADLTLSDALVECYDLLYKWCGMRMQDANAALLPKLLELLVSVTACLAERRASLQDVEVLAFMPALLRKLSDSRDSIRELARTIVHRLTLVHSYTKVFMVLFQVVNDPTTIVQRVRSECLGMCAMLVRTYGLGAADYEEYVRDAAPLRAIARIAATDKDASTRSAALQIIDMAQQRLKEGFAEIVEPLSNEERSTLIERLRQHRALSTTTRQRGHGDAAHRGRREAAAAASDLASLSLNGDERNGVAHHRASGGSSAGSSLSTETATTNGNRLAAPPTTTTRRQHRTPMRRAAQPSAATSAWRSNSKNKRSPSSGGGGGRRSSGSRSRSHDRHQSAAAAASNRPGTYTVDRSAVEIEHRQYENGGGDASRINNNNNGLAPKRNGGVDNSQRPGTFVIASSSSSGTQETLSSPATPSFDKTKLPVSSAADGLTSIDFNGCLLFDDDPVGALRDACDRAESAAAHGGGGDESALHAATRDVANALRNVRETLSAAKTPSDESELEHYFDAMHSPGRLASLLHCVSAALQSVSQRHLAVALEQGENQQSASSRQLMTQKLLPRSSDVLRNVFERAQMARQVESKALERVVEAQLDLLVDERLAQKDNGERMLHLLNVTVLRCIDGVSYGRALLVAYRVIARLLVRQRDLSLGDQLSAQRRRGDADAERQVLREAIERKLDLAWRCVWRPVKKMAEQKDAAEKSSSHQSPHALLRAADEEIAYDTLIHLLVEIDAIFLAFPPHSYWQAAAIAASPAECERRSIGLRTIKHTVSRVALHQGKVRMEQALERVELERRLRAREEGGSVGSTRALRAEELRLYIEQTFYGRERAAAMAAARAATTGATQQQQQQSNGGVQVAANGHY